MQLFPMQEKMLGKLWICNEEAGGLVSQWDGVNPTYFIIVILFATSKIPTHRLEGDPYAVTSVNVHSSCIFWGFVC